MSEKHDERPWSSATGQAFKDVDMSGAVFERVSLRGATFRDVSFAGSTFENVSLGECRIEDACLARTSISDFNWDDTRIEGILVSDLLATYEKVHGQRPPEPDK